MEKKEYDPPITICQEQGKIRITCDKIQVDIPPEGPVPNGTPPVIRRIFEAFSGDLPGHLRAE